MPERLVYKVSEAATLLDCSTATTYALIHSKELPSMKVGTELRVTADGLKAYLAKCLKKAARRRK